MLPEVCKNEQCGWDKERLKVRDLEYAKLEEKNQELKADLEEARRLIEVMSENLDNAYADRDRWIKRMQMLELDLLKIRAVVAPETIGPVSREKLSRQS
jgi:hypothetical protein